MKRFWSKVDQSGGPTACWPWTAARIKISNGGEYGGFRIKRRTVYAHRFAFSLATGLKYAQPEVVMHSCDNPCCCNPAHLNAGTYKQNSEDMVTKGRSSFGERCGTAKLTQAQVEEIRVDPRLHREIAEDYPVHKATVSDIKRGRSWTTAPKG